MIVSALILKSGLRPIVTRLAPLLLRAISVGLKIVSVPLSLSLLSDADIPLYFVLISATSYLSLADTGLMQAAHTRFTILIARGEQVGALAEYSGAKAEMVRRVWFVLGILTLVSLVYFPATGEYPNVETVWIAMAIVVFVSLMPLRASVPLSYALRKETSFVACELVGQIAVLSVMLLLKFSGGGGTTPLGWVLLLNFLAQLATFYLLDITNKYSLPKSASASAKPLEIVVYARLKLFFCSVGESMLLFGDTLIFAAVLSPHLAAKIGFLNSIWLQMLMVTNIMLIRVWTNAAAGKTNVAQSQREKFGVDPMLLASVVLIGLGGGLILPFMAELWTQGRIGVEFSESLALMLYYFITVACTAVSFRTKGLGLAGERIQVLAILCFSRAGFVWICSVFPNLMTSVVAWYLGVGIISLAADLFPSLIILKKRRKIRSSRMAAV